MKASVNICMDAITSMTDQRKIMGDIRGRVICQKHCNLFPPSNFKASYKFGLIFCKAARNTSILPPPILQVLMITNDSLDQFWSCSQSGPFRPKNANITFNNPIWGLNIQTQITERATPETKEGRKNVALMRPEALSVLFNRIAIRRDKKMLIGTLRNV